MGPLRTAQLVAIVATPHRFRRSRQLWSYSGLSIVTRSSSDWVQRTRGGPWVRAEVQQTRGLSRKRQPVLKSIFKGAATTVIAQLVDHPLHAETAPAAGRHEAESGQAHARPPHRSHRAVDVEARGGVRPGSPEGRDGQAEGAAGGEAEAARWVFGAARRERFEGEHPFVCWSPGRDGETPDAGYAPSEYRLKQWPEEAQSGAWCPPIRGDHNPGCEVGRIVGQRPMSSRRGSRPRRSTRAD